jgi:hypothetical protein
LKKIFGFVIFTLSYVIVASISIYRRIVMQTMRQVFTDALAFTIRQFNTTYKITKLFSTHPYHKNTLSISKNSHPQNHIRNGLTAV